MAEDAVGEEAGDGVEQIVFSYADRGGKPGALTRVADACGISYDLLGLQLSPRIRC
ncbi:hypothetical protein [Amycolatopsis minnesotensis]|uniref:Uncharacterized protein n=1 Tax=Amycolatopsis minnesotensis TaxID=337894 RepID=A0ABN2SLB8_9PSEU